ncbi:hypothetical protein Poli38472_009344 [Pythium oligandrum]|uniref:Uncharacterized protein n=1 Tax=Pythium oligandrum TaxID=41045 RepID=A0A8K1FMT1_PYTOL|nr:hypothetical protein Poli38472_009344 [Pythium oligandrum]|eukprot:TMW65177.1 hypothetical protein Poli38472_009344 [Pythium oligandrum]
MTELRRFALFDAAASGDVATIERFFRQPSMQPAIERVNQRFRNAFDYYVERNDSPFLTRPSPPREEWHIRIHPQGLWELELLFVKPAKHGHVRVFAWFCSDVATEIIGDSMRYLLYMLYSCAAQFAPNCAEITEAILLSHLFASFNDVVRSLALSMMLGSAIKNKRANAIRVLVAHGALVEEQDVSEFMRASLDMETIQALEDGGVAFKLRPY